MRLDREEKLSLPREEVIGQRIAVLGISGSGKTNTVAVLCEELLGKVPLTIVDVEGEYYPLKEQYQLVVAGRSEQSEVPLLPENAAALAEVSIRRSISVILDLSEYDQDEMQQILLSYFQQLWKLSTQLRSPYEIVIEEAHEFVPQAVRTPLKTLLTRFALRGRKRGVGVILASQRSAKVEKDLLTQANLLFLHAVVHPVDLGVYKDLIPLISKEVEQQARALEPGEAFVVQGRQLDRVHMRRRHTFHAGATPTLDQEQPRLLAIDAALLSELAEVTARAMKEGGSDEVSKLKKQLREAEAKIIEREAVIERQAEQIELLSRLTVVSESGGPTMLEVQEARIGQVHVAGAAVSRVVEAAGVVPMALPSKEVINEGKWSSLHRRLMQVSVLEREVLRVLIEQGRALSMAEIAVWLKKSVSHMQNHPPQDLLGLGLITRSRRGNGYVYRATLAEYLRREFPEAESQQLQERLMRAVQKGRL